MNISDKTIEKLKHMEGFAPKLYDDAGHPAIGYGCDLDAKDAAYYKDKTITEAEATTLLKARMKDFERAIWAFVHVTLSQNQHDALCLWVYNVGIGALKSSTLLKKLNAGDYAGAAEEFLRWDKVNGASFPPLTKRRHMERDLFLG